MEQILSRSIAAGADVFLDMGSTAPAALVEAAYTLYERGEVSLEQINAGALRVLELKIKHGLAK